MIPVVPAATLSCPHSNTTVLLWTGGENIRFFAAAGLPVFRKTSAVRTEQQKTMQTVFGRFSSGHRNDRNSPSESPRHFAALRDESVIVGYYTRTSARNVDVPDKDIDNTQKHNEREKDSYRNPDIIPERLSYNVHFKNPAASYTELFAQMESSGMISTRGLKPDAIHYGELIFDVNSAYFHNYGGYEFAKQFYAEAYQAAVKIVGGEQYILSAVMHADEINRAMSEALGQDVYHYHLHVVYVPVVEKQILWSKRCKDKALVGTVKETIMQVSRSKKWLSGNPVLQKNGKPVLKKSYSILQDDFYQHMRAAGYTDVERGERGSTEEHLTVTQFKVAQEQQRLEDVTAQIAQTEQALDTAQAAVEKKKSRRNCNPCKGRPKSSAPLL